MLECSTCSFLDLSTENQLERLYAQIIHRVISGEPMRSIFAVLLSLFATGVFAEEANNKPVFSSANISVTETKLEDNATDGCWTNLKQSREYLDEQFKMNGYKQVTRVMNMVTSPRKNLP